MLGGVTGLIVVITWQRRCRYFLWLHGKMISGTQPSCNYVAECVILVTPWSVLWKSMIFWWSALNTRVCRWVACQFYFVDLHGSVGGSIMN
jgi:hypothetical protein